MGLPNCSRSLRRRCRARRWRRRCRAAGRRPAPAPSRRQRAASSGPPMASPAGRSARRAAGSAGRGAAHGLTGDRRRLDEGAGPRRRPPRGRRGVEVLDQDGLGGRSARPTTRSPETSAVDQAAAGWVARIGPGTMAAGPAPRRPARPRSAEARRRRPRAGAGRTRRCRPARATGPGRPRRESPGPHRLHVEAARRRSCGCPPGGGLVLVHVGSPRRALPTGPWGGRGCARPRCCAGSGWCPPRWRSRWRAAGPRRGAVAHPATSSREAGPLDTPSPSMPGRWRTLR